MSMRALPSDLAAALSHAREVERVAVTRPQWLAAVRASTTLASAALTEGWTAVEIAAGLGIEAKALRARLARAELPSETGLAVTPPPPSRIAPPLPPVDQREWLTLTEAAEVTGASGSAISQWQAAGLLPSTRPVGSGARRYARSDIERVLSADERDGRGVRWEALRAQFSLE